jgi:mannan endo-1,4-beta-mannosidase
MNEHFVGVEGSRLTINGSPYFFAGANFWDGCYLGSPGPTGDRERLIRELDFLHANGITNLRIMAASEASRAANAVTPPMQRSPGEADEDLLQGLDFLIAGMAVRGMRAVLYLNNFWDWSGGMAAYIDWTEEKLDPDPAVGSRPWREFVERTATFYGNRQANEYYRQHIRRMVMRRNTVSGTPYVEDPTIMSWQLANEPRPGLPGPGGRRNLNHFFEWIGSTAAYIHELDRNHLVSTGSEGCVGCLDSEENFLQAHGIPGIDYLTFHVWPYNWRWFDPRKSLETLPQSMERSRMYILLHIDLAARLGKPTVLEEYGLSRDGGSVQPGSPTEARDEYFRFIASLIHDAARSGAPVAGSNFWAWGGEAYGVRNDIAWKPEILAPGDPPHEPRGFNAIYDTDVSTLSILKTHAEQMRQLQREIAPAVAASRTPKTGGI